MQQHQTFAILCIYAYITDAQLDVTVLAKGWLVSSEIIPVHNSRQRTVEGVGSGIYG